MMKKALRLVLISIITTLTLAVILGFLFVLYTKHSLSIETTTIKSSFNSIDVFLYSFISLLPFTSIIGLVVVLLRLVKSDSRTVLEFLTYTCLSITTWLILIPFCILSEPEQKISSLITGKPNYAVSAFFESQIAKEPAQNLEAQYITPPSSIVRVFKDLLFLRNIGRIAGEDGRTMYLLFISMGLSLFSLYALSSASHWKLLNATAILTLSYAIIWLNIKIYEWDWNISFNKSWIALGLNGVLVVGMFLFGIIHTFAQQKEKKIK